MVAEVTPFSKVGFGGLFFPFLSFAIEQLVGGGISQKFLGKFPRNYEQSVQFFASFNMLLVIYKVITTLLQRSSFDPGVLTRAGRELYAQRSSERFRS